MTRTVLRQFLACASVAGALVFIFPEGIQAVAKEPARDCDCRASGRLWSQGEKTCMNGSLYVCGMNQNISSWEKTSGSCPVASLKSPVSGHEKIRR
jgi:hypothetical protein